MAIRKKIELGISTCPNDTFAFHGLMTGKVDDQGLQFQVALTDVQDLNDELFAGQYDVAKASFHAALRLAKETLVLPSGSALGFENGPLLLSRHTDLHPSELVDGGLPIVLCPGATTTATLLYQMFYQGKGDVQQVVFSEIMPALRESRADFGVCIHEGRFTWRDQGLTCLADLGELWHSETRQPLPLGGILARRHLGEDVLGKVQQVVHDSILYGLNHPDEALETMRQHAAEMDDEVLMAHVDLYVNDETLFLGKAGREALAAWSEKAIQLNSPVSAEFHRLEVFGDEA